MNNKEGLKVTLAHSVLKNAYNSYSSIKATGATAIVNKNFKSGFISIIGRPNVGKSTLLNTILEKKIAIVSSKPQTTRNQIIGVHTTEDYQMVFLDTPGIHKPKNILGEYMVNIALNTLHNVDIILYVVSCDILMGKGEVYVMSQLKKTTCPIILLINKSDLFPKEELLPIIDAYQKVFSFKTIIPISALKKENIDPLMKIIESLLPDSLMYYPKEIITNQSEKQIISEIVREKILFCTKEEVPHSVAVVTDYIKEDGNLINIYSSIYVERKSQKGILIGKGGKMLQKIGKQSRVELEKILCIKVYLDLRVKVKDQWRCKEIYLRNFGYE